VVAVADLNEGQGFQTLLSSQDQWISPKSQLHFRKKVMKKKGEDEQEKRYELLFILDSLLVDDTLKRRALTCKSLFWL